MQKVLRSLESEPVSFSSDLPADNLLFVLKTFRKENSKFSWELIFGDKPNLDIMAKSNYQIEISPLWQFVQIPGYGMNVKLKGTIIADGQQSKIAAVIKPHRVYPFLFWTVGAFLLFIILYWLTRDNFRVLDAIPILVTLLFFEGLLLTFCTYCKRKLIRDIQRHLSLTEIK